MRLDARRVLHHALLACPVMGMMLAAARGDDEAPTAAVQVARLGRGINVLGYDPVWEDPAKARVQPRHFARIRDGGFQHVRINLQAFVHMDGSDRLDPGWLHTLDGAVAEAQAAGLMVILDEHDFGPCGQDADQCRKQLLAFWEQIADRYSGAPDTVLFELLNEPNGQLTAEHWNALLIELLGLVRRSNPTRTVVIGPANYNNLHALVGLSLPETDRNILVTVHYYDPLGFTHQGAPWMPDQVNLKDITWGTPAEHRAIEDDFNTVAAWSNAHGRPILLGEFGAYERGDMASRTAWTAAVARSAEARGFAWAYWQFDHDFVAFDIERDDWVKPIHDALVPP